MNFSALKAVLIASAACFVLFSCAKKKSAKDGQIEGFGPDDHYFSLAQFTVDQYNTMAGQPIVAECVVTKGGRKDSSLVPLYQAEWAKIYDAVRKADFSDRKYLGRYNYSEFLDSSSYLMNIMFEAKEQELTTQRLLMTADPFENNRIVSVYVQMHDKGLARWMYYEPGNYLRYIEEDNSNKEKNLRLEYWF